MQQRHIGVLGFSVSFLGVVVADTAKAGAGAFGCVINEDSLSLTCSSFSVVAKRDSSEQRVLALLLRLLSPGV